MQEQLCFQTKRDDIKGSLRKKFKKDVKENIFENNTQCTFQIYLFILRLYHKDNASLTSYNADASEIKRILWKQYVNFMDKYEEKILLILSDQGKRKMVEKIRQGILNLEQAIMSEDYYLTNLDIILLNLYYNLPIVLISLKKFGENKKKVLLLKKNEEGKYFYIKQGAIKRDEPRLTSLLYVDESFMLDKTDLSEELLQEIEVEERSEEFPERLNNILQNFKSVNFKRKKKVKLIIEDTKSEEN